MTFLKYLFGGALGAGALLLGGTADLIPATCPSAAIHDVYDTPSGKLDVGFYDARAANPIPLAITDAKTGTTTPALLAANVVREDAFLECKATDGSTLEIPISISEFNNYSVPGGKIRQVLSGADLLSASIDATQVAAPVLTPQ